MRNSGYYSQFGGAFIPEILVSTFDELESAYLAAREDPSFWQDYLQLMSTYSCRATPITRLDNLSAQLGGASLYVKREDLNHTGAHKANNVMGQGLVNEADGKDPRYCRNRCRTARCCDRNDGRPNSVLIAPFIWVLMMWLDNGPMFSGWSRWGQRSLLLKTAARH